MKKLPAENKEAYKKMHQEIIDKIENGQVNVGTDIEIKRETDKLEIEGYSADKYQLWQKGTLKEDVWIAEELDISDELNFEQFKLFFSSITNIAYESSRKFSRVY